MRAHALIPIVASVSASVTLACAPPVLAQPAAAPVARRCQCPQFSDQGHEPGVIWRGDHSPMLEEIAALAAPILWFSPDEPLILSRDVPLPNPLPCDKPGEHGVVYYQLHALVLGGSERVSVPEEGDPRFFEKVRRFTLRYFFYYRRDVGFSGHEHDLEGAEFEMALERTADGCREVRITRIRGFAHGVDWYWNELHVPADTRFPITLIVEEGKHATAPDRNADGIYTPGYDVNRRVNDAWGVRDVLASGYLIDTAYTASMTKPRRPDTRAHPLDTPLACPVPADAPQSASRGLLNRYELRRADTIGVCPAGAGTKYLAGNMTANGFGAAYHAPQYESTFTKDVADQVSGTTGFIRNISFRYDHGPGASLVLPGLDLRQGYLVPKINLTSHNGIAIQGLLTSSAARFFSPYVAVGAGHQQVSEPDPNQPGQTITVHKWDLASELGVKFRFRVSGKARILALGSNFAGVRFGYSAFGFSTLNMRIIVEVGVGVW